MSRSTTDEILALLRTLDTSSAVRDESPVEEARRIVAQLRVNLYSSIDRDIDNAPDNPDFSEAKQLIADFGFDDDILAGAITASLFIARQKGREDVLSGRHVRKTSASPAGNTSRLRGRITDA